MQRNVLLVLLSLCLALTPTNKTLQQILEDNASKEGWTYTEQKAFEEWSHTHQMHYNDEFEAIYRMGVFLANKRQIDVESHNSMLPPDKWGLNQFSDREPQELVQRLFMTQYSEKESNWEYFAEGEVNDLQNESKETEGSGNQEAQVLLSTQQLTRLARNPTSVDWMYIVNPVEHQGFCGSCWAFSASDVMISRLAMRKAARLKPLSKSHLLDCVGDSVKGCEGGSLSAAYEWMNKNGALYEEEYRDYDAKQSKYWDRLYQVHATILESSDRVIIWESSRDLETALQTGPVSIAMIAGESWFNYNSGVIDTCSYPRTSGYAHAVVVVGYDQKNWIVRNSWGKTWGEQGYFRVAKSGESKCVDKIVALIYPLMR